MAKYCEEHDDCPFMRKEGHTVWESKNFTYRQGSKYCMLVVEYDGLIEDYSIDNDKIISREVIIEKCPVRKWKWQDA